MKEIEVKYRSKNTKIQIENNIINNLSKYISPKKKYFILTDENVFNLYGEKLKYDNFIIKTIKPGEVTKTIETVIEIINYMLEAKINKGDILINFGGGVVSDLGGFVASIYKRGISYINIPTTLLAQVDAAIGGKTGIDFISSDIINKNQIGSIHHPDLILVDPKLISTLPREEYLSGIGEVIKYGICFDEELFLALFQDFNLESIISRCIEIKAKITEIDELDENYRHTLNFGHTIGHAIEAINNFQIPHGVCIIYGMLAEIDINTIKEELRKLLNKFKIDYDLNLDKDKLITYILQDKKIKNGIIKIPRLEAIGKVVLKEVEINEYIKRLK